MRDTITVCVPVYQAARFVAETIDSVLQQSFDDFRLLVSVDPSEDESEAICRSFERDKRVEVIAPSSRLGWAGNVNFLLDRVDTEYFIYISHDDLWHPDNLRVLLNMLHAEPAAASAYSCLDRFGMRNGLFPCRDYRGTAFERVSAYLSEPFHPIPLRGLMRSAMFGNGFRLREYGFEGILAERIGVFEILYAGVGLYCPEPLCRKRVIETSASRSWVKWSSEKKRAAWDAHYAAFVDVVHGTTFSVSEKQRLVDLLPFHVSTFGDAMRGVLDTPVPAT